MRHWYSIIATLVILAAPALVPAQATMAPAKPELQITWLGCAGCEIKTPKTTILVDPFLSRPPMLAVIFDRLKPDTAILDNFLKGRKVDYILVSHSHYDHAMDVPYLATKTGAKVIGSQSAANLMRASKLPRQQTQVVEPGCEAQAGDVRIKVIGSAHSVDLFGDSPYKGEISSKTRLPMKASGYKMGDVYAFLLTIGKTNVFFSGTANYDEDALKGVRADVAIVAVSNRQNRRGYTRTLLGELQPDTVIPTYYDIFFRAIERGLREMPGVDVNKFYKEVNRARPGTKVVKLGFFETYRRALAE